MSIIGWDEVVETTLDLFIDKRDTKTYLRLVDVEDSECIESGAKIEIKYCPFCGNKL